MPEPSPKEFQPYRRVQAGAEADLTRTLEATARAIQKRIATLPAGVGGQVRAAQLRTTLAAIKKLERAMWTTGVSPRVQRGVQDAVEAAESAIETMTRVAYASLPEAAAEALIRGLRASAESGLKSDAARHKRELSERVYSLRALHEGKIEELIRSGLIANLSAKELAGTVYKYVSPTTPGGASYAAMRLARTEINNAFHERQLAGAQRPGVRKVKWNLSGSHKVPDLCNVYASHGDSGEWDPNAVPDKPHPQCFCYLTYITMPAEEFRNKLAAGDFDNEIDRRTRENMARLGQPVGDLVPSEPKPVKKLSLVKDVPVAKSGQSAHDIVPKGLFKPGTLNSDERAALKVYESGWFMVLNDLMRSQREAEDNDDRKDLAKIELIKNAMKQSLLPEPIQVWRGMFNARTVFKDHFDSDLTGFAWDDLAFGSTTTNEAIIDKFNLKGEARNPSLAGDVKMKIHVPARIGALETSTWDTGSAANGPQAEITLENSLTWKVVKDNGFNSEGVRELEVEVNRIDD